MSTSSLGVLSDDTGSSYSQNAVDEPTAPGARVLRGSKNSSLRTTARDSLASEFKSSLVDIDSAHDPTSSKRAKARSNVKLRHDKVGYYGREQELAQLQACLDRLVVEPEVTTTTTTTTDHDNNAQDAAADDEVPPPTKPPSPPTELVLIGGPSGTGKTRLARQLKLPVGSTFLLGKCDWNAREEPYSSIADACEMLCRQINYDQDANGIDDIAIKARTMLLDQLNVEVMGYLWDLIPSLRPLVMNTNSNNSNANSRHRSDIPMTLEIPVVSTDSNLSPEAKQQQMNHAFRVLIRAFSSCYTPFILCLDDLQWMDAATLELIPLLLKDIDHNQILIIGCYRSDEVEDNEQLGPALLALRALASKTPNTNISSASSTSSGSSGAAALTGVHVTDIELSNLSIQDCNSILIDLLSYEQKTLLDVSKTESLADICHRRTLGNVNFFLQFVVMLQETRLLDFNPNKQEWQWDIALIEAETHAAGNVLAVVERRMAQLKPELQHFLSVAATLGATASLWILELAWKTAVASSKQGQEQETNNGDFSGCIYEAVLGNFLELCGNNDDQYKFVHDKIQEAAANMFPEDQRKREEFAIGMRLMKELPEKENFTEIFLIRDLLDSKEDPTEQEAELIININLQASKRARSCSAFKSSLSYAKKGLSLLPADNWKANYDTTAELHFLACEAAGATGQPELLEKLSEIVLARPECSFLDKLRIYKAKMDKMANDGDPASLKNAISLLIKLLRKLDCKVPWPRPAAVPVSVISTLLQFKGTVPTEARIQALPRMVDEEKVECLHLLYRLQGYAYFQKDVMLSVWAALKIANMTLQHGRHEVSSTSFPAVGMAMTGMFGEFQKGRHYSRIGEILVDMEDNKSLEGRTFFTAIPAIVYMEPVHDTMKPLIKGYKSSMQAGDTESAIFCLAHHSWLCFISSKSLNLLEADCHRYLEQANQLRRMVGVFFLAPLTKMVATLTGSELSIDSYLDNKTSELFEDHLDLVHAASAVYMGNYQEAADLYIKRGSTYDTTYPAMPIGMLDKFLAGVAFYGAANNTGQRKYKKQANAIRAVIRSWAKKGNPNSPHWACLLDAEFHRMKKDMPAASKLYRNAAKMAVRTGFLHDEALANERHALFLLSSKDGARKEATSRLRKAIDCYRRWGALAKVNSLEREHSELLGIKVESPL